MFNNSTKLFIGLIILAILLDILHKQTITCIKNQTSIIKKIKVYLILVVHHIINIFANFGWLLNDKRLLMLYIISPIFMLIYWKLNNNKCDLTLIANDMCGWSEDTYFNDFFNILHFKRYESWNNIYHKLFLLFGVCVALYKLFK